MRRFFEGRQHLVRAGDEVDFLVPVKRAGDAVARAVDVHHLARLSNAIDGA